MRTYEGSLYRKTIPPEVKRAETSFQCQHSRCRNPKVAKYAKYGGRGIELRYSKREFIGWWLDEIARNPIKNPTVGRIDHDGHYEFGNIVLQSRRDNSIERNRRVETASPRKAVVLIDSRTGERLVEFASQNEASRWCEVHLSFVTEQCTGRYKTTRKDFSFRYA